MAKPPLKSVWRVTYKLRGKVLADVQVDAISEAQALIQARSLVKANLRRLADETLVQALDAQRSSTKPR